MTSKIVSIEWRRPTTKDEKSKYGTSQDLGNLSKVFINTDLNKDSKDLVDTFFHEMAHVFLFFHGKSKKMSAREEEMFATKIGNMAAVIMK